MENQEIRVEEREDGIGIITLNRPKLRNAISIRMRREISACLHRWEHSSNIGAVILIGAESTFSAGFDLSEFENLEVFDELLESSSTYHRDVWNFPKPTIAAINGPAMGGGFDLVTLCDIRICAESAVFGHPEIKFGAPPIFTPLRWIIGDGLARDLCLTGRRIHSKEAQRIGLVSEIVEDGKLLEKCIELGKTVLEAPSDTIQFTKAYFIGNSGKGFEDCFQIEHDKAFRQVLLPKAQQGFK